MNNRMHRQIDFGCGPRVLLFLIITTLIIGVAVNLNMSVAFIIIPVVLGTVIFTIFIKLIRT